MGYLLPALTDAKFENQRDVVLNERRQNYENRPYGLAGMAIVAALYPPDHPYHWLTIGAAEDIRAPRIDDVREFFRTYYRPRNASLAIAGDVAARTRRFALADDYFGELEAGETRRRSTTRRRSRCTSETRLVLEDRDRAAAPVPGVAFAGAVRARRRRARSGRRGAREREDVAPVSRRWSSSSGSRPRSRPRRTPARSAASFRSWRPRLRAGRWSSSSARSPREIAAFVERGSDRDRDGTLPGPGGSAVRLPAADGRRIRRQGRSAERLQRLSRQTRTTSIAISRAIAARARPRCSAPPRTACGRHQRVALSVVPRGRTALALADSQPVAVS